MVSKYKFRECWRLWNAAFSVPHSATFSMTDIRRSREFLWVLVFLCVKRKGWTKSMPFVVITLLRLTQ